MRDIVLIAHNIRSSHNVGSILRTADGFGVNHVYFTGYTPYPTVQNDERLPHLSRKLEVQIDKTALGAINYVDWSHEENINNLINNLRNDGYNIAGLEQDLNSKKLPTYTPKQKTALLLGEEVKGISEHLRKKCDELIEIPMYGHKESFNVAQATAITLYALRET